MLLHQNMPGFFADIGDLADTLEHFSEQDFLQAQITYSYSNSAQVYDFNRQATLIDCLAVTEHNLHVQESEARKAKGIYQM